MAIAPTSSVSPARPRRGPRLSHLRQRIAPALGVAFGSFVVLGMCDAALGTAWPSIRHALGVPIGDLGLVQLAGTAGFLVSSFLSGRVAARLGRAGSLVVGACLGAAGLGAVASAPTLAVLLPAAILVGLGAGSIEPSMQSHIALSARARTMNLLHGFYGLGATVGPILVSGILLLHASWRLAYVLLLTAEAVVGAGVLRRRRAFNATTPPRLANPARLVGGAGKPGTEQSRAGGHQPIPRVPPFALGTAVLLFAVYCGVEVATGQWAFSLLTSVRHLGTGAAGVLVAAFWAALTVARMAVAAIGERIHPDRILVGSAVGALVGECLLWWNPVGVVGAVGLLVTGASLAPAFPLMMIRTPRWAPGPRVSSAIGWQSASASVGIAAFSGLAGLLVENFGLPVLFPYLTALSALFLVLQLAAIRVQERRQQVLA